MRQKLNSNPRVQMAVLGVLLVITVLFVVSSMGGGEEAEAESSSTATATSATVTGAESATPVSVGLPEGTAPAPVSAVPEVPAPPPPRGVIKAYEADKTVVLAIVKKGAFEDKVLTRVLHHVSSMSGVALFTVPADRIFRYAAITQGLQINRVPALIVVRPKRLDQGTRVASVSYGVQSIESAEQAVRDARYKGRTLSYHP